MKRMTVGQIVRTTQDSSPRGYMEAARKQCRWGAVGEIIDTSDAHGLSYEVRHEDQTTAWYEPAELVRII